jgi:catechol-2,3-dioxygenase
MPTLPAPAVVLFVHDVPRLTQFYRAIAPLTLLQEDSDHAVLEVQGFQLIIHALRWAPEATTPPVPREDSYHKVCLPVASIAAAREAAAALGGVVQPVDRQWSARGFTACDGFDPEGNVLQVRERADGA